jgi:mono/diheme cytochrome c family protein
MKKSKIWFLFILPVAAWVLFGVTMILSGGMASAAPNGTNLYALHCGACHPHGGNKINPAIPLTGSAKMKSLAVFTAYNRNPLKANGSKGVMPAFPKDKISDNEMKLIYDYSLTLSGTGK